MPELTAEPVNGAEPCETKGWHNRDGRLRGSAEPMAGRCGRKLRGTVPPRYCAKYPMKGKTCCERCGGATPSGAAHPNYRGGLDLSSPRGEKIAAILDAPNLLSLAPQFAALISRMNDLLAQEQHGTGGGTLWDDLADATAEEQQHQQAGEPIDLARLALIIAGGRRNESIWRELRELFQEAGKLASAEGRRQSDMGETATKLEVRALMEALARSCKEHIGKLGTTGEPVLRAIAADMQRLTGPQRRTAPIDTTAKQLPPPA